jgi:Spy/CpxP family protein refolding chaperone
MKSTFRLGRHAVFFMVVLLMAVSASAQGKWWNSDQYKRELGLTADQSRRLEEIFQGALPTLRVHKKSLDDAEGRFNALVERGDDKAVMEQVGRVELARAELNKTRTIMLLKMRRTLTSDQWLKLGALHQANAEKNGAEKSGADKNSADKTGDKNGKVSRDGK